MPEPYIFPAIPELGQAAAAYVAQLSAQAIAQRGRFMVALSGGSLPKMVGPALAAGQIDWSHWHVFWADERCVPLTNAARQYLFDRVNIPPAQIYPLDDTLPPPTAAAAYQARLAEVFQVAPGELPRFDLILLGLGEDGHTASLFLYHPLLREKERWAAAIFDSPKPPPVRVTLTLPVINQARQVAFVAAGAGKAVVLAQVFKKITSPTMLPVQMVQPVNGEVCWFVDEAAANLR
jgi:6-phosphogluconolactonase